MCLLLFIDIVIDVCYCSLAKLLTSTVVYSATVVIQNQLL